MQNENTFGQIFGLLRNGIVITCGIAAVTPIIILELLHNLAPTLETTIPVWLWIILALIFGLAVGALAYNTNYRFVDQTLNAYVSILEQVAAGDLRQRLVLPSNTTGTEGKMLGRLGDVINRTL